MLKDTLQKRICMKLSAFCLFIFLALPLTSLSMDQNNPLAKAIHNDNTELAHTLIESGININMPCKDGSTILHHTVHLNKIYMTKIILAYKPDVNAKNIYGNTPLHIAAINRNQEIIPLLIANGADINIKNKYNQSASDIIKKMYCFNQLVENISLYCWSEIHNDILFRNIENIIDCNPEVVNMQNINGNTPLYTIFNSDLSSKRLIELFLEKGASITIANNKGTTFLHRVSECAPPEIVELLLKYTSKDNLNLRDKCGNTPLHLVSWREKQYEKTMKSADLAIANLFLKNGAQLNIVNNNGNTPLHNAIQHQKQHLITLFLTYNANLCIKNNHGETPRACFERINQKGIFTFFSKANNSTDQIRQKLIAMEAEQQKLPKLKKAEEFQRMLQRKILDIHANNPTYTSIDFMLSLKRT